MRARAFITAHPLLVATLAALLARTLAAILGLGFHARDDYFHVLEPALRWLRAETFDWDMSDAQDLAIRSHLVPRAVEGLLLVARGLGIGSPEAVLRFLYMVVGLYSLLVVPAMWLLAGRILSPRGQLLATWLAALHFAMPYAGTRLLIEAMAMPPLVFGIYLATFTTTRRLIAAGLCIGFACWLRFQVGTAALGVALAVGIRAWPNQREVLRQVLALALGGGAMIALEGLYDLATVGGFLATVLNNVFYNLDSDASPSSPAVFIGLWLLLTVPPATLVVVPAMLRAGRRWLVVSLPFVCFVLLHSFVPHKEERFMLPVLPLFLLLLAAVPEILAEASGSYWDRLKSLWPATRAWLVGAHLCVLVLAVTNQSQANVREAMTALRLDAQASGAISLGPEIWTYFLGDRPLITRRDQKARPDWLPLAMQQMAAAGAPANRFLVFEPDRDTIAVLLAAQGLLCDEPEVHPGWWLDRALYELNPKRNKRRAPVLIFHCDLPQVALLVDPE